MKRPSPVRNEAGVILFQVLGMSILLLGVLFMGFRSVKTSVQLANTAASSASLRDLTLYIEQTLAVSATCADRIRIGATGTSPIRSTNINVVRTAPGGFVVNVRNRADGLIAYEEPPTATTRLSNEFRIREVRIRNVVQRGFAGGSGLPGGGRQELERHVGEISIVAERRSEFAGARGMTATIPIIFSVTPGVGLIRACAVRENYRQPLGPATLPGGITRKTGSDCIDRGGFPTIRAGDTFFSCRVSDHAFGVCKTSNTPCNDQVNDGCNLPGWYCLQGWTQASGVSYVY